MEFLINFSPKKNVNMSSMRHEMHIPAGDVQQPRERDGNAHKHSHAHKRQVMNFSPKTFQPMTSRNLLSKYYFRFR